MKNQRYPSDPRQNSGNWESVPKKFTWAMIIWCPALLIKNCVTSDQRQPFVAFIMAMLIWGKWLYSDHPTFEPIPHHIVFMVGFWEQSPSLLPCDLACAPRELLVSNHVWSRFIVCVFFLAYLIPTTIGQTFRRLAPQDVHLSYRSSLSTCLSPECKMHQRCQGLRQRRWFHSTVAPSGLSASCAVAFEGVFNQKRRLKFGNW